MLVMYSGEVLVDPSNERVAAAFGMASRPANTLDVAIVGAGPCGTSAGGIYGVRRHVDAGHSTEKRSADKPEEFPLSATSWASPCGISGASLATRAFEQAWSFGTTLSILEPVTEIQVGA